MKKKKKLRMDPLQVVFQFLKEEGYFETFDHLIKESGKEYKEDILKEHVLRQTLGELKITQQNTTLRNLSDGKIIKIDENEIKKQFDGSPIALHSFNNFFISSFTNGIIRIIDEDLNIQKEIITGIPTILCFDQNNYNLFFASMGGFIGSINLNTLEIENKININNTSIISIKISGDYIFAASQNGILTILNKLDFTILYNFQHQTSISAMCKVKNGIIYSCQNDNSFHFRNNLNPEKLQYFLMNPIEFDLSCLGIRELKEHPNDSSIFLALTDKNRILIYKMNENELDLEILANITQIISDGLTQPQIIWPFNNILISTHDDIKIIGINIQNNDILFILNKWQKSTRCLCYFENNLLIGSFDKTLIKFKIN